MTWYERFTRPAAWQHQEFVTPEGVLEVWQQARARRRHSVVAVQVAVRELLAFLRFQKEVNA
jgi:hypothetical protein